MAKKFIFLTFLAFILSCCISKKETNDIVAPLDEFLTGQSKFFGFNGNVLVAEKGEIVFQKSYGFADFKTNRLLNDSSVFELASISKQFTATAILMLKDEGKLQLTDSLKQYFPELPYSNITIYQMLTHTSGLPDYFNIMLEKWDNSKIFSNNEMIALFAKEKTPVHFPPGTGWEYSNTAYAFLASIIEKVSGMPFSDYLAINIFQPLQMSHTRVYDLLSTEDTISNSNYAIGFDIHDRVIYHPETDDLRDLDSLVLLDGIQGHVAVNSTTTDLLKWDRSVKDHTLLSDDTQKEMLEKHVLIDTLFKTYYGFGVYLNQTEIGYLIYHSGGLWGYNTFLSRNADNDQTVIVLSNNDSKSRQISMALHEIINGKPIVMPYEHKEVPMDSTTLQQFTGKYKAITEISIERTGNKLFRISSKNPKVELRPESATKFFYNDGTDRQLEFELDSNKNVVKLWLIGYGRKVEYQKY